jgi:hypothetical protein
MTPAEICRALDATDLRPMDLRRAERLVTRWAKQGHPASEIAMHRAFIASVRPLVARREAARKALKRSR